MTAPILELEYETVERLEKELAQSEAMIAEKDSLLANTIAEKDSIIKALQAQLAELKK